MLQRVHEYDGLESEACTGTSQLVATSQNVRKLVRYEQGTVNWPLDGCTACLERSANLVGRCDVKEYFILHSNWTRGPSTKL